MAKESLVNGAKTLFHHLKEAGMPVERMLFLPAYEGMVEGLYILVVIMPGATPYFEKTEYIIHALHEHIPIDQRQGITGIRVFDSLKEFYEFIDLGYMSDNDEDLRIRRSRYKPELIPIAA